MVKKDNKKGWIKVVEAFMAIVLLLGFLMVVIAQYNNSKRDNSLVLKNNFEILNGIEMMNNLRNSALSVSVPLNSGNSTFPSDLKSYLLKNTLPGYNCTLYVCNPSSICAIQSKVSGEVYSTESIIFSNATIYSPRKLKIFCYS